MQFILLKSKSILTNDEKNHIRKEFYETNSIITESNDYENSFKHLLILPLKN